ncbi:dephospho-CoA kinase [Kocuria sp.]|uniref:dephospho-CoA kinase n=1 Tax=Kocuria sp. TaxID=1871328 RepID=UPI0026E031CA|nr:dephospho-CoA kinase [Kocuria sp.]MDO5617733.1 dephospho-CoA kinase [Kocuria sp.]
MLHIALTGGIASGKSAVAARLVENGAVLVDSDVIVRQLQEPAQPGLVEIAREFGPQMIAADGSLDRRALGELIFADDGARARLNAIIHPLVRARSTELVEQAVAEHGEDVVIVHDIPLLVETGQAADFDVVLVVEAPRIERIRRMVDNRGMSEADAAARIDAQAADAERRAVADHVFLNDRSLDQLETAVDQWWTATQQ